MVPSPGIADGNTDNRRLVAKSQKYGMDKWNIASMKFEKGT